MQTRWVIHWHRKRPELNELSKYIERQFTAWHEALYAWRDRDVPWHVDRTARFVREGFHRPQIRRPPRGRELSGAERETVAALRERFEAQLPEHRATARALFDAVFEDPDDDGRRAVLADFLLAHDHSDPRGEFIGLQPMSTSCARPCARGGSRPHASRGSASRLRAPNTVGYDGRDLPTRDRSTVLGSLAVWIPTGSVPEISAAELHARLLRDEPLVLLDVRTRKEWDRSRIVGTLHVPITEFDARLQSFAFPERALIVAICRSAHRSIPAVRMLHGHGHAAAVQLQGGMKAWWKQGLPVEGSAVR